MGSTQYRLYPPWRNIWHRFADVQSTLGLLPALIKSLKGIVYREYRLFFRDLTSGSPRPPTNQRLKIAWLHQREIPLLCEMNPGISRKAAKQRLADGYLCLIGRINNEPVYYRWYATKTVFLFYLHREFKLGAGEILLEDTYTRRSARRQGVAGIAARQADAFIRQQGNYRRQFYFIAPWNRPALQVRHYFSSYRQIGSVKIWGFGPVWRYSLHGDIKEDSQGRISVSE